MKNVLMGLSLLVSVSAFANCNIIVEENYRGGALGAPDSIVNFAKKTLKDKGYNLVYDARDAEYTLLIDTQSSGMTQECDSTVSASTVLIERATGRKKYEDHQYRCSFLGKIHRSTMAKKQIKNIPAASSVCR